MHTDPLLKSREVCAILSIGRATLYRRIHDGSMPPPIKLGGSSRWARSDIVAAIEAAKKRAGEA